MSSFADPRSQRRFLRDFLRDGRGATAAETAMVLPVLLLVLLGVIEFGRTMKAWNEVSHALGKAIRVVNIDNTTSPEQVRLLVADYLKDVETDALSVSAAKTTVSGTTFMKVTVSFPFHVLVPFWGVPTLTLSVDALSPVMAPRK